MPECLTAQSVSIGKSDAYEMYCFWSESHDIEPTRPAWFGRDLKTLIPKLQEGRDTKADGSRVHVYRGLGVRPEKLPDNESDFTTDNLAASVPVPASNGVSALSLSGQSGHLDCFVQLFNQKNGKDTGKEKVIENNENARTARTERPNDDSEGENLALVRESRRMSHNLRQEYRNGYVVQPDPNDLSNWRVGKNDGGTTRWLEQHGTRDWAVEEVMRRTGPTPTLPACQDDDEDGEDHTADVLYTLICDIDDGRYDMTNEDDMEILKDQVATDIPEVAEISDSLLLDLDNGHVTLDDVRQRVDEMLAVLLQSEEEMTEDETWKWLDENLVGTR